MRNNKGRFIKGHVAYKIRGKYIHSDNYLRKLATKRKTCRVGKCLNKVRTSGLCNKHYLRMFRYGRLKRINKEWWGRKYCYDTKLYAREYRKKHHLRSIFGMRKMRFGGLRELILERDGFRCQICGMTEEEHIIKYGEGITIDHLDGSGRCSEDHNNVLNNLWTLCVACHGARDSRRGWMMRGKNYNDDIIKLYRLESG